MRRPKDRAVRKRVDGRDKKWLQKCAAKKAEEQEKNREGRRYPWYKRAAPIAEHTQVPTVCVLWTKENRQGAGGMD